MNSVHAYPPTGPHRIMTSTVRTRAPSEAAPIGFMRRHEMDDFDDLPEKKSTQEEQDEEDEKARKRAMRNLVNSWQERLQLISVITTFFASTEAALLVNTKPLNDNDFRNSILQASNASFLGALIVHVYAAVLSFLGAFLLISYKLREATRDELIAEGIPVTSSPLSDPVIGDIERGPLDILVGAQQAPANDNTQAPTQECPTFSSAISTLEQKRGNIPSPARRRVHSTNPHIEQVGLFKSHALSHRLLSRTHGLCVFLAGVGFVLNIVGILCYSWALQPTAVSIFASVCLGGALLTIIALLV